MATDTNSDSEDARPICKQCGHEMSRHDPEDGTCDAHRSDGGFGVCPCGRDESEISAELMQAVHEMVDRIENKYGHCCGDVLSITASDLVKELTAPAATEAKYCPKCGHESVKNHLCKDATPVVGMIVDVHLDTDDMCGAEAGMSNVIRAKITSIEPPYLIVVDVENDEEFEVTPGQCVPAATEAHSLAPAGRRKARKRATP
jgi:hypothetical protein